MADRSITPPKQHSQGHATAKQFHFKKPMAVELWQQGSTNMVSAGETVNESNEFVLDCEALIDVVAYLLDRRRRRLAEGESEEEK